MLIIHQPRNVVFLKTANLGCSPRVPARVLTHSGVFGLELHQPTTSLSIFAFRGNLGTTKWFGITWQHKLSTITAFNRAAFQKLSCVFILLCFSWLFPACQGGRQWWEENANYTEKGWTNGWSVDGYPYVSSSSHFLKVREGAFAAAFGA